MNPTQVTVTADEAARAAANGVLVGVTTGS
jgi:hypothetical protein